MLRGMRKASSNWLGKIIMAVVMGVLIISFGVWGIADIFRGFGQSTLAKVGRTEISTEQFRQIYNDRLQQVGRQFGRPLTQDQARALGFDRQVLQQTVAEAALDAGKAVRVLERRTQAADHPILLTVPETHYLKCLILEVLEG